MVTKVYNIYVHAGVSSCVNVRNACGDVLRPKKSDTIVMLGVRSGETN